MPWCDTDAMAAHLIEISAAVDPGAHAVLIVDQAGWHLTRLCCKPDVGVSQIRTTTVLSSCFCVGQTVL